MLQATIDGDLVLLTEPGGAGSAAAARVLAALRASSAAAAVACGPVTDTLKVVDADGQIRGTAERDAYRVLQPPAAVRAAALGAGDRAPAALPDLAGILAAVVAAGGTVLAVDGGTG